MRSLMTKSEEKLRRGASKWALESQQNLMSVKESKTKTLNHRLGFDLSESHL